MIKRTALITLITQVCLAASSYAATFTVNSTLDQVDSTPGNGSCATAGGTCTLRAAVQEANASAGGDTINIPAGVFVLSIPGAAENLSATGDLDISESVVIKGAGVAATILSAAGIDRFFDITNAGAVVTFSDFTETSGNSGAENGAGIRSISAGLLTLNSVKIWRNIAPAGDTGGLIHMGPLTITDSEIVYNKSQTSSGISVTGPGPVNISDSDISFNQATSSSVGGMFLGTTSGDVTLSNTTITNNISTSSSIGGVYIISQGNLSLTGVSINKNTADSVGGFYLQTATTGNLSIANSNFNENTALTSAIGAGILLVADGNANLNNVNIKDNFAASTISGMQIINGSATKQTTVDGCTISGNYTPSNIGGMYVQVSNSASLSNCTIDNNFADTGVSGVYIAGAAGSLTANKVKVTNNGTSSVVPGLYLAASGTANVNVDQSEFSNNSAISAVGGLYVTNSGTGTITLQRSLFSGNQAEVAAAAYIVGGSATIENNTFSSNIVSSAAALYLAGTDFTIRNNTFADNISPSPMVSASLGIVAGNVTISANIFDSNSLALQCLVTGGTLTSAGNNISDDSSCNANIGLGDLANTDSQVQPLANNGGATFTRAVYAGSPAHDKFTGAACPATDQRASSRPVDGDGNGSVLCDAGAYENTDVCPNDPGKLLPGVCGCGNPDVDTNGNSVIDCLSGTDLKRQTADLQVLVAKLKAAATKKAAKKQAANIAAIKTSLNNLIAFANNNAGRIGVNGTKSLQTLLTNANSRVNKATKVQSKNYNKVKKAAVTSLKDIIDNVVG